MLRRTLAVLITAAALFAAPARAQVVQEGNLFNPLSDPNWLSDFFPITIMGISMGGSQPPTIEEPPICECPSHLFGYPVPGIGMTYWEPNFVVEVSRQPGDMMTLGGFDIFGGTYSAETGGATSNTAGAGSAGANRAQVHWYNYPIFAMIGEEFDSMCTSSAGTFNLAAITEVDPTWQNDIWSQIFSPEASLFATPIMHLACPADAAASAVAFPLDPIFWCAGAWGSVYPFSGNPNNESSDQQGNAMLLSKFLARQFRLGLMWATIGPEAVCSSVPSPIWIKTEFRVDPVFPLPTYGLPIYFGQTEVRWGLAPPSNFPAHQSSAYLLWQAHQCCLRF